MTKSNNGFRSAVALVAMLNFAYFGIEFLVAGRIGSVSLFADSVDFLEDAAVNLLIFAAIGWSASQRANVGVALSGMLLIPAIAFVWMLWRKLASPTPPEALSLTLTGGGALIVNVFCAVWLARWRNHGGSLTKAAFLSARNDAIANVAIMGAGIATLYLWRSTWPDVLVGLAIAAMNIDAARAVWRAARQEKATAQT